MAVRIQAGWTFGASIPSAELTVTEATGSLDFDILCNASGVQYNDSAGGGDTVNNSATQWCHEDLSGVLARYKAFATALEGALDAASTAHGNGWTYTVTYSSSALTYTISASGGNIALDFAGAPGTAMRQTLGFTGSQVSAASHTSDARPYYTVNAYLGSRSRCSGDYEQGSLIRGAIAGDGQHYSTGPRSLPILFDWVQEFEADAPTSIAGAGTAVNAIDISGAVPWAWQDFFQHVRAVEPFGSVDTTGSGDLHVHYMRPEAAHFAADQWRRQADWDKWDVPLKTFLRGRA